MQDAEEQDTCRICSAPAEPDQPLFHPCKCSGTIRYIHQDCLTTWLAHSKKKSCDVCKHPYSFTKVYAPNMPLRLPVLLLVRRLIQSAFFGCLYGLRAISVATIWLVVLPLVTVWTWRVYFSMGDSTALWISKRERPGDVVLNPFYQSVQSSENNPPPASWRLLARLNTHSTWQTISADIFSGQIIASLIVLTFVAVFLLREWISQNARPGFFEDDIIPDERPQAQEPRHMVAPVPPPMPILQQRPIDENPDFEPPRVRPANPRNPTLDGRLRTRSLSSLNGETEAERTRNSAKERERLQRQSFSRRLHTARVQGQKRRLEQFPRQNSPGEGRLSAPDSLDNFAFTFTAKPPSRPRSVSAEQTTPHSLNIAPASSASSSSSSSIFPSVQLDPPRDAIPYQLTSFTAGTPSSPASDSSPSAVWPRRPPLPSSFGGIPPSPLLVSPARTPQESPSLSTYRAPEELEAGPSDLGYFSRVSYADEPTQEEEDSNEEYEGNFDNDLSGVAGPSNFQDDEDGDSEGEDFEKYFPEADLQHSESSSSQQAMPNPPRNPSQIYGIDLPEFEGFRLDEDGPGLRAPALPPVELPHIPPPPNLPRRPPANDPVPQPEQNGANAAEAAANAAAIAEAQEDLDANAEDDMEGAMEAIGMRGPVYGVLQNATLMIFVLDTAMGLGIWIPYTIGKSTALLTLDPPRLLRLLHFPIRLIRVLTDPIVDGFVYILTDLLFPLPLRLIMYLLKVLTLLFRYLIRVTMGTKAAQDISDVSELAYNAIVDMSERSYTVITAWPSDTLPQDTLAPSSIVGTALQPVTDFALPFFASLGARVRVLGNNIRTSWISLALGNGAAERIFALGLGYAVAGVILALYLNILSVGNMKTAGRAVRNVIRQQLLVLKVAMFIFVELVTFPLGCGLVLDASTIWLFPEASITSRLAFFFYAPLTAMFYHWIAGTMFMYSFAILLSGCRSILRPGAMWFIRDPQDQNAHPIRDILDRPTLTQFRKICVSGFMYTVVVICGVASIACLLLLGDLSILPLNWKNRTPLSDVPIDLLFLHLILPYSMHYFRPKRAIKNVATHLWKVLAKKLRLTSYYFGERRHVEEYTPKTWGDIFGLEDPEIDDDAVSDGYFRRVPATDNIALPRDMRATALVTEDGRPIDDHARRLIEIQDAEAAKAKRSAKDDFMVVYIPPNFTWRILIFIGILWVVGSILLGLFLGLPITIGRSFFSLFYSEPVHDGYTFIVGFYILWGCYAVGVALDKLDRRRQRRPVAGSPRADLHFLALKRGIVWTLKALYMVVFLGIIVPTLLGIVMDLYIVFPFRIILDPELVHSIRIVDSWALGLLYAKIVVQITQIRPGNNAMLEALNRITTNGWTHLQPWAATKELIAPLVGGLGGMILFPAVVFQVLLQIMPLLGLDYKFSFIHLYPGIFCVAAVGRGALAAYHMLNKWSQKVRDKEFLVEMRLRNHDPTENAESDSEAEDGNRR